MVRVVREFPFLAVQCDHNGQKKSKSNFAKFCFVKVGVLSGGNFEGGGGW